MHEQDRKLANVLSDFRTECVLIFAFTVVIVLIAVAAQNVLLSSFNGELMLLGCNRFSSQSYSLEKVV